MLTALACVLFSGVASTDVDCSLTRFARHKFCYDPNMDRALSLAANISGVVLDVGANGGRQSWTAHHAGRYVYAIECLASAYAVLLELFKRMEHSVQVLHACGGNLTGLAQLHLADDSSSLLRQSTQASEQERAKAQMAQLASGRPTELVLTVPMDILFAHLRIAVVKVDTQGSEHIVMSGMRKILTEQHPVVLYENDRRFGNGGVVAHDQILAPMGYRCHKGSRHAGRYDLICAVPLHSAENG
jgi:FkbM family methyltransferase